MLAPRRALVAGWITAFILTACPDPPGPPGQELPVITAFEAQPYSVRPGDSTTISWTVQNADTVTLHTGTQEQEVGLEGSEQRTIEAPLEAKLVAQNAFGQTQSQLRIITPSDEKVTIEAFEVSPPSVQPGEAVEIHWRTTGATNVSLLRATGVAVMDPAPTQGTFSFRFRSSAVLRLVASGLDGPAIAELPLEVVDPPPLITVFEPAAPQFREDEDILIRVETERALQLELKWEGSLVFEGAVPEDGLLALPSSRAGIFNLQLRAFSLAGEDVAETQVRVVPLSDIIFDHFETNPSVVGPGGTTDISWQVRGAEATFLTPGPGPVASSGQTTATIQQSTVFALRAVISGQNRREEREVVVDFTRPGLSTRVDPMVVPLGETATLSWQALTATSVEVFDDLGQILLADAPLDGSLVITPSAPTSYLVRAANASGETAASVFVDVDIPPTIDAFVAPSLVRTGLVAAVDIALSGHEQASLQTPSSFRTWNANEHPPQLMNLPPSTGTHGLILEARSRRLTRTATRTMVTLPRVFTDLEPNDEVFQAIGPSASYPHIFDGLADEVDLVFFTLPRNRRLEVTLLPKTCSTDPIELSIVPVETIRPSLPAVISAQGECPSLPQSLPGLSDWSTGAVRVRSLGGDVSYQIRLDSQIFRCGDTILDRTEQCDDGNRSDGDGCDRSCRREDSDEAEPNDDASTATPLPLGVASAAWLRPQDIDVWVVDLREEQSGIWRLSTQGINAAPCPDMTLGVDEGFRSLRRLEASTLAQPCPQFEIAMPPGRSFVTVTAADEDGDVRRSPVRGGYQLSIVPAPP